MRSTISSRLVPSLFGPIWAAATFIPRTSRGIAIHLLMLAGPRVRVADTGTAFHSRAARPDLHRRKRTSIRTSWRGTSCKRARPSASPGSLARGFASLRFEGFTRFASPGSGSTLVDRAVTKTEAAALVWLLASLGGVAPARAQAPPEGPTIEGPSVSAPASPAVFDQDVRSLPPPPADSPAAVERLGAYSPGVAAPPRRDPLLQDTMAAPRSRSQLAIPILTPPILNFDGARTGANPHDPIGDVGSSHYVQMINSVFTIYSKAGAVLAGPSAINSLWTSAGVTTGPCATQNLGDPVVLYDPLADRWLLSQLASPSHVCIAVSRTPDPVTGGYHLYEFNVGSFPDYFKLGVWPDAYYMAANFGGDVTAVAFDRANMLNGNPATFVQFNIAALPGLMGNMMLPGDLDGTTPPLVGSPNPYYRQVDGDNFGGADRVEIWDFHIDWGNPSASRFSGPTNLPLAAFDSALCGFFSFACIPQPGTSTTLDPVNEWPMWRLQYRNFGSHETLVGNFVVDVDGMDHAGIRWFELRRSGSGPWAVFQQGTFAPQDPTIATWQHRWLGSIAMDKAGNIGLAYNISSSGTIFPSIRYAGRLTTDPVGLMPQGEEVLVDGGNLIGSRRWGDYSSLNVDPVDDCTFWYTSDYVTTEGLRQTHIGTFRFPSCIATDLAIAEAASPDPVLAGEILSYAITVTNNGSNPATNVVVVDVLPEGTSFLTSAVPCAAPPASPNARTCALGALRPGEARTFTIQVRVDPGVVQASGAGVLNNTASLSADEPDPDLSNNTLSVSTIVNDRADLRLTKACEPDEPLRAGTTATCEILVDNLGPSHARNVVVRDTHLGSGPFTITSATFSSPIAGACAVAGRVITCDLGSQPAGGHTSILVSLTASEQVDVSDTATVTSDTPDGNSGNNTAEDAVRFVGAADLGVAKTDMPDPVEAGTNLAYRVTVSNAGPSTAPNVVVQDGLPSQVSVVTFTSSQGSCSGGVPGDALRPLSCRLGSLAPGGSVTLDVVVRVNPSTPDGTILVNNASVSSDFGDPNNGNDNVSALTTVQARADLAVTKTSDAATYNPWSVIAYTVTVVNHGPSDAPRVVVTDTLPNARQAFYLSDTGGCTLRDDTLSCNLGDMPTGTGKS